MTLFHTNTLLREFRLPALSSEQLQFLQTQAALETRLTNTLTTLERISREGDEDCRWAEVSEPATSLNFLRALIAEVSYQQPAACPELADAQARLRTHAVFAAPGR